jgi:hypothetical protein
MMAPAEHRTTLLIEGWNEGFNKIAFTKMLQQELGFSLGMAKNKTDQVLEGRPLAIDVASADSNRISLLAQQLGANVAEDSCR